MRKQQGGSKGRHLRRSVTSTVLFRVSFLLLATMPLLAKDKKQYPPELGPQTSNTILWANPSDIASRDLFYGSGGKQDEPHTIFTFVTEDRNGTSPKFDVHDENGIKWRVKLGPEARPEVAASRLMWAVGYFTTEDYFLADLRVENMPRLRRGNKLIAPDGTMHNVRLRRFRKSEKKVGDWEWNKNPFSDTREFNGLRVMMALLNNWDLKTENNAVYEERKDGRDPQIHYMVSDLGSTFGSAGVVRPNSAKKGNPLTYSHSKLIKRIEPQYVDFNVPARPTLWLLGDPKIFNRRMHMRWIGHKIPRADARWMGQLLCQLSKDQIRQAFRAAGYSAPEVEQFATIVEERIRELNQL